MEPGAPSQETTKAGSEAYTVDAVAWGRGCKTKLKARGDDAHRYDLIPSTKATKK